MSDANASFGAVAGVTGVSPGEVVVFAAEVDIEAGPVYQDVLQAADGSIYFASYIEIAPQAGSPLVPDPTRARFLIDGVVVATTTGTQPSPSGFVLDTSGGKLRVYLPGDGAAMIANPTGYGVLSYTAPAGGSVFRLEYAASAPAGDPGTVLPGVACRSAYSVTASTNRASGVVTADVALNDSALLVTKAADPMLLAIGGTTRFEIAVSVPLQAPSSGTPTGSAFDVVVTDTLPAGLHYVAGSASDGGSESSPGIMTWTIPQIDSGQTVKRYFTASVDPALTVGSFTNVVVASGSSAPGASSVERTFAAPEASVTVTLGPPLPSIDKSFSVSPPTTEPDRVGTGTVTYTVEMTFPAVTGNAPWFDVTVADVLPDGLKWPNLVSLTCSPNPCPVYTQLPQVLDPNSQWRTGLSFGQVGPFSTPQTWRWTYAAWVDGSLNATGKLPLGSELTNTATLYFNTTDALGGVPHNLLTPYGYDGSVTDTATVRYNRPVLTAAKRRVSPSPLNLTPSGVVYEVTVTNSGGVAATNVLIEDTTPLASGISLGDIDPASLTISPSTSSLSLPSPTTFVVDTIPANSTVTIGYAVNRSSGTVEAVAYTNYVRVANYYDGEESFSDWNSASAVVTPKLPKLTIAKDTVVGSPSAGDVGSAVRFRLTVTNNGTGSAYNVAGSDTFPAASTITPRPGCGLTFTGSTYTAVNLNPGASVTCDIDVRFDEALAAGTYANTAAVTWTDGIGHTGTAAAPFSATDDAPFTVNDPVLTIVKDTIAGGITSGGTGEQITFRVTITNTGIRAAYNVAGSDVFPSASTITTTPGCELVFSGADFTAPDLAAGASVSCDVVVTLTAAMTPGDYTNVATVGWTDSLGNTSSPSMTYQAEDDAPFVDVAPKVIASKTTLGGSPSAGDIGSVLRFRLALHNPTTSTAYHVAGSDEFPSDATITPLAGCNFVFSGSTFTAPHLAPGATEICDVDVTLSAPLAAGSFTNVVRATWTNGIGELSPDPTSVEAEATSAFVVEPPKVVITKDTVSGSPSDGEPGSTLRFRVTLENTGIRTARSVAGSDLFPVAATITPVPGCALSFTGSTFTAADLAPGASVTCLVDVTLDERLAAGTRQNTADVTWADSLGNTDSADGPFADSDDAAFTVVDPSIVVVKTPDNATGEDFIVSGEDASYTITVTNTSTVAAYDLTLNDVVPATLTLAAAPTITGPAVPFSITSGGAVGDAGFDVAIPLLAAGTSVTFLVPVHQDGAVRPDPTLLVNTATVVVPRTGQSASDTGTLEWVPKVDPPVATKSAVPAAGPPGSTVTWTITATVPNNALADLYDVAFVDTLPDGFDFISFGAVSCAGSACGAHPATPITPESPMPDGSTRLGWMIGDLPFNTGELVYTLVVNAKVSTAWQGTGVPADGTAVTSAVVQNTVRGYYGTVPTFLTGSPDLATPNLATVFQWRVPNTAVPFRIGTPVIELGKEVANKTRWVSLRPFAADGYPANVGDTLQYAVTLTNSGTLSAYNVVGGDDLGLGKLINISSVTATPDTGFVLTDGPTTGAPGFAYTIAEIPAGASVVLTYTGTTLPSDQLSPALSSDSRDVALIQNTATVSQYESAPASGVTYTEVDPVPTDVYVYTPMLDPRSAGCTSAGNVGNVSAYISTAGIRNSLDPLDVKPFKYATATPPGGYGTANALTYTFTGNNSAFTVGSAVLTIRSSTGVISTGPIVPTSLVSSPTGDVVVFALGNLPAGQQAHLTFGTQRIDAALPTSGSVTVTATDASGATSRGSAVGAPYSYSKTYSVPSCGSPCVDCVPGNSPPSLTKSPDNYQPVRAGDAVVWYGSTTAGATWDNVAKRYVNNTRNNPKFTDTLPAGVSYAGTSRFWIDGRLVSFPGVVTQPSGPTGPTVIVYDLTLAPASVTSYQSISYQIDTSVAVGATFDSRYVNTMRLENLEGDILTDTGSVAVASLTKFPDTGAVLPGETVTWFGSAKAPATASGTGYSMHQPIFTDTLPAGLDYSGPSTFVVDGVAIDLMGEITRPSGLDGPTVLVFDLTADPNNVYGFQTIDYTIPAVVKDDVVPGTLLVNTITLRTNQINSQTDTGSVGVQGLSKYPKNAEPMLAGSTVNWYGEATTGSSAVTFHRPIFTDMMPAGVVYDGTATFTVDGTPLTLAGSVSYPDGPGGRTQIVYDLSAAPHNVTGFNTISYVIASHISESATPGIKLVNEITLDIDEPQATNCVDPTSLCDIGSVSTVQLTKTPDRLSVSPGESIDWTGEAASAADVLHNPVFTDTLPAGLEYNGPAEFEIDGETTMVAGVVSRPSGPGGPTVVVFDLSAPPLSVDAFSLIKYRIPTRVASTVLADTVLVNTMVLDTTENVTTTCSDPTMLCDTGTAAVNGLSKYPDNLPVYAGDTVVWSGTMTSGSVDVALHNPIITDTMPAGLDYNGTATFTVDGVPITLAGVVTQPDGPGGRTVMVYDLSAAPHNVNAFHTITYEIPTVVSTSTPAGTLLINGIVLDVDETLHTDCADPSTLCDTGSVVLPPPASVTKYPKGDAATPGSSITWTGTADSGSPSVALHNPVFTDTMPSGLVYDGPARFTIDGQLFEVDGVVTEPTTTNPNTTIVFDLVAELASEGFDASSFYTITYEIPSRVAETGITPGTLTNSMVLDVSDVISATTCADPQTLCDTGSVVLPPTKTIDQSSYTYATSATYTIEAAIPASAGVLFDATISDRPTASTVNYSGLSGSPMYGDIADVSFECVSGCAATDPAPIRMPNARMGDDWPTATWYLGDLPASTSDRLYRWTFQVPVPDKASLLAAGLVEPTPPTGSHTAELGTLTDVGHVGWYDADTVTTTTFTPDDTVTLGENARGQKTNDVTMVVNTFRPSIDKTCVGTVQPDVVVSAPAGEVNARCTITITNNAPAGSGVVLGDRFTVSDTITSLSVYADEWWFEGVLTASVEAISEPTTTLSVPLNTQVDAFDFTVADTQLAPGESYSVTFDLRVVFSDPEYGDGDLAGLRNTAVLTGYTIVGQPDVIAADVSDVASLFQSFPPRWWVRDSVVRTADRANMLDFLEREWTEPGSFHNPLSLVGEARRTVAAQGEPVTFLLNVVAEAENDTSTVKVENMLPPGTNYIPGSARLVYRDALGIMRERPFEPTGSGLVPDAPAACPARDTHRWYDENTSTSGSTPNAESGGNTVAWSTNRILEWNLLNSDVAPTDPALEQPEATYAWASEDFSAPWWHQRPNFVYSDNHYLITFDVVPTGQPNCFDGVHSPLLHNQTEVRWLDGDGELSNSQDRYSGSAYVRNDGQLDEREVYQAANQGWPQWAQIKLWDPELTKSPDGGVTADDTTTSFSIDLTVHPVDLDRMLGSRTYIRQYSGDPGVTEPGVLPAKGSGPYNDWIESLPWGALDDVTLTGRVGEHREFGRSYYSTGSDYGVPDTFSAEWVVTDTLIDDGNFVCGSGTVTATDPWGDPFPATTMTELSCVRGIDAASGRANVTVTWRVEHIPSGIEVSYDKETENLATGEWSRDTDIRTFPSHVSIRMPLSVPKDTEDDTRYDNHATGVVSLITPDGDRQTFTSDDTGWIVVRRPSPPPPVDKHPDVSPVAPGAPFVWELDVKLPARQSWVDLAYTDTLPLETSFTGYETAQCLLADLVTPCPHSIPVTVLTPTTNAGRTTVSWWLGDLESADYERVLRLRLNARMSTTVAAGDEIPNTAFGFSNRDNAYATPSALPVDFFYQVESTGTATVGEPLIEVDKVVDNIAEAPFAEGATVRWKIAVTNVGETTAHTFRVVDRPDGEAFDSVSMVTTAGATKAWTASKPWVEWNVDSLAPGATIVFELTGVVKSGVSLLGIAAGRNEAEVPFYRSQPVTNTFYKAYAGVTDDALAPFVAPNIEIAKFAGDCVSPATVFDPTGFGTAVEWCLVVTNTGAADANNVSVEDLLPPGWSYVANSAVTADGPAEPTLFAGATNVTMTWSNLATVLPSGGSISLRYDTLAATSATTVTNTATVTATLANGISLPGTPVGYWDRATAFAEPIGSGLAISNTPDFQDFRCDDGSTCPIAWDVVVTNTNETVLTNLTVTNYLPPGVTFVSAVTPAGWSEAVVGTPGSGPGGTTPITWTHLGPFGAGESTVFTVNSTVDGTLAGRTLLNDASATADQIPTAVRNQALGQIWSPASVGNYVWVDLNSDGVQDSNEPPIAGAVVTLYDADGMLVASQPTSGDGSYSFTGLAPGTYNVVVTTPSGFSSVSDPDATVDGSSTVTLASGEDNLLQDFGYLPSGAIGDRVWSDVNGDGVQNLGEPGLVGVRVDLTWAGIDGEFGSADDIMSSMTTGTDGAYLFENLPAGSYRVAVTAPAQTVATGDPDATKDSTSALILGVAERNLTQDFGYQALAQLSGRVFVDGTSTPLADVLITLVDAFGRTVTALTDENGAYSFVDLVPGNYTVTETQPDGYGQGVVVPGGSITVSLAAGQNSIENNFSEALGSIAGQVFVDGTNAALANVVITLTGTDVLGQTVLLTTETDNQGRYIFPRLIAGAYTITETQPDGYLQGIVVPTGVITVDLGGGQNSVGNDFSESLLPPPPTFNLAIEKVVSKAVAKPGDTVTWTITVTNTEDTVSAGAIVASDPLPPQLSFVRTIVAPQDFDACDYDAATRTVACRRAAPLEARGTATFALETVLVSTSTEPIANIATVRAADGVESSTLDNRSQAVIMSVTGSLPKTGAAVRALLLTAAVFVGAGLLLRRRRASRSAR